MSKEDSLLEELRTAYQGLGPNERQQVKTLLLTLARTHSELIQPRRVTQWKQLDC